jgi:hypothetical protein
MPGTLKFNVGKAFLRDRTNTTPDFIQDEITIKVSPEELAKVVSTLRPTESEKYGPQFTFRMQILKGKEGPYAKFYIDEYDHPEVKSLGVEKAATASPF